MTFPEGKDIFSFEIQTGDFTHTSPKFKIAVQNLYVFRLTTNLFNFKSTD